MVDRGSNLDSAAVYHGAKGPPDESIHERSVWIGYTIEPVDTYEVYTCQSEGHDRIQYIRADVAAKEVAEARQTALDHDSAAWNLALSALGARHGESLLDAAHRVRREKNRIAMAYALRELEEK